MYIYIYIHVYIYIYVHAYLCVWYIILQLGGPSEKNQLMITPCWATSDHWMYLVSRPAAHIESSVNWSLGARSNAVVGWWTFHHSKWGYQWISWGYMGIYDIYIYIYNYVCVCWLFLNFSTCQWGGRLTWMCVAWFANCWWISCQRPHPKNVSHKKCFTLTSTLEHWNIQRAKSCSLIKFHVFTSEII